jgi:DNA-directed RNA polymerase specialized sigma24 family protein
MGGPTDDPYMRELARRALQELEDAARAHRLANGLDPDPPGGDLDDFDEPPPERVADPVLADFFGGTSRRALADARDGLADAKVRYERAIIQARAAGWSWPEVARVLGVSKQSLHSRFRDRAPG